MNNADMKPNRFLNWHKARKLFSEIQAHLAAGGRVVVATCTKATAYSTKHIEMFKVRKDGVYVQRGKHWDCLNFTPIKFI